jgi:peroxiredoxin
MVMTRRSIVAALALAATVAAGAAAYQLTAAGEQVPSVAYTLLDGTRGDTGKLDGKVVLINFWATSCATCVKEMPQLVATHRKYQARGYDTLAVAMSYDPPAYVARYAQTRGLPFGVAIDNTGAIAKSFGDVRITPTTLVVNRRGEIVRRFVGEPDFAALHRLVEKLLAEA